MAATIRVTCHHTNVDDGSTTDVAGTSIYMKPADADDSSSGIAHNVGSFNYSWVKNIKIRVQAAPIQQVYNLKAFWTGTPVTNIDVLMKRSATYLDPVANAATPLVGAASVYTYPIGASLSLSGNYVVGVDTAPKFIGDWVELQAKVGNAAVASNVNVGGLVIRWDEQ